jgi:hypothetical protein
VGTIHALARHGIQLREGLTLTFYTDDADDQGNRDDLLIDGVVTYSPEEQSWVAAVDWNAIRNASDEKSQEANGVGFGNVPSVVVDDSAPCPKLPTERI